MVIIPLIAISGRVLPEEKASYFSPILSFLLAANAWNVLPTLYANVSSSESSNAPVQLILPGPPEH